MRPSFWWQMAAAIFVVLVAFGIRSSVGQAIPPAPSAQPRQTLNIDFIFVLVAEGRPVKAMYPTLHTSYKEVMVDKFTKWYPFAEEKTRVAIVGSPRAEAGIKFALLVDWTTEVAKWETELTTVHDFAQIDFSIASALKLVHERLLSGDSMRPKVVLFSLFSHTAINIAEYKLDEAKEIVNKLKADGVLILMALQVDLAVDQEANSPESKMKELFGCEFVYDMSTGVSASEKATAWREKIKGLPAWIESRVTFTFCQASDASFYNDKNECKHGKYHFKVPLAAGDCEALGYKLPELTGKCDKESCEETCDRLWPLDVACSASTCDDKAPKRQGPMKWKQLKYCPEKKLCQECVTTTMPPPTPGDNSGGEMIEGSVVHQLIIVISAWLMISG